VDAPVASAISDRLSRRTVLGTLGGLVVFIAGITPSRATPAPPPPAVPGRPQYFVAGAKAIALTLDDGPDPRWTPPLLALLGRYQISATFSVVGAQAVRYPELVRAIAAEGHTLSNHTYTHPDLAKLPRDQVRAQIEQASEAIARASGGPAPHLFRAPYGAWSPDIFALCAQMGLHPVDWSVDPRDWSRPGVSRISKIILSKTRPGSIILEHDGGGDRAQTVAALRDVLPRLKAAGYHFVTL
jgi:peptidoglycan-N-acetylglucosamine deacetylase